MKAVFDTKPGSGYDDEVSQRYHFPRRYAGTVLAATNDWVVLRRPRANGGNLAYFATARVARVDPDPNATNLAYARLEDFLPFDIPVPWMVGDNYAENALRNLPRPQVGVYLRGRSVRPISDDDFANIVTAGLTDTVNPANADRYELPADAADLGGFDPGVPAGERAWRICVALQNRVVRDASFRRSVCRAYDDRCSITGLRMINMQGRSEVHAAHIWPVAEGGPDVVQNGIALCATAHWLLDHHLITFSDDYRLILAENRVPSELRALFQCFPDHPVHLPKSRSDWPHPSYLARHRQVFARKWQTGAAK